MFMKRTLFISIVNFFLLFSVNCQSNNEEEKSSEVSESVIVNGDNYSEEEKNNITILKMSTLSGNIGNIDFIMNFPNLEEVYIEKYNLTRVPVFANVPKLMKISLMKNELSIITNSSFLILGIKELYLARNKIEVIYDKSFGYMLKELYLTCNSLKEFSKNWFSNPEAMQRLHLAGNEISTIKENTFKVFSKLEHLDLRQNQLTSLEDNSFSGLHRLQFLKLGYNNLEDFRGEIFGSDSIIYHLTYLELTYNQLSFLPPSFFSKFRVDNMIIWANPWQCACKSKIKDWWIKNNNFNVTDIIFNYDTPCVTPLSFGKICVSFKDIYVYEEFNKIFKPIPLKLCEKSIII